MSLPYPILGGNLRNVKHDTVQRRSSDTSCAGVEVGHPVYVGLSDATLTVEARRQSTQTARFVPSVAVCGYGGDFPSPRAPAPIAGRLEGPRPARDCLAGSRTAPTSRSAAGRSRR